MYWRVQIGFQIRPRLKRIGDGLSHTDIIGTSACDASLCEG